MPRARLRFRPPGLKPWTKVGTLGPSRQRLGLAWVIAPLVTGIVLLGVGWYAFLRPHPPGPPWVRVASLDELYERQSIPISSGANLIVVHPAGDATRRGASAELQEPCRDIPVRIYQQVVYVNPADPMPCPVGTARSGASP
jgi:hypothetical protein